MGKGYGLLHFPPRDQLLVEASQRSTEADGINPTPLQLFAAFFNAVVEINPSVFSFDLL